MKRELSIEKSSLSYYKLKILMKKRDFCGFLFTKIIIYDILNVYKNILGGY